MVLTRIDAIYSVSAELGTENEQIENALRIFKEASEPDNEKSVRLLGLQMLFRHFHEAPNQNELQEFFYKTLNDPERDVRMLIINSLPNLCRYPKCAEPVSYVLAQLLVIAKGQEQALVQKSLCKVFLANSDESICSVYNCAMESTSTHGKIRIMWFLENHMPTNIEFSERIKKSFGLLYIQLIRDVDADDAAYLIQCLTLSSYFSFTESLRELTKRIREDIFDLNGLLLYVATKLLSGIVDEESRNEQILARMQFLNEMLVKADLSTFENIVDRSALLGIVEDTEMRILRSKILEVFCQEKVPTSDLCGYFHKLNRIVLLCKNDFRTPYKEVAFRWVIEDIEVADTLDRAQQKNFFMAVVTLSMGKRHKMTDKRVVKTIFNYIWKIAPNVNADNFNLDLFELEIIAHYLRNVIDVGPSILRTIEGTNPQWRECLHHFAALLVLTNKGLGSLLANPQQDYDVATMQRQFFIIAKTSKMFCELLQEHRGSEALQEPSWINNGDLFDDITYSHVMQNKEMFVLQENPIPTIMQVRGNAESPSKRRA